MTKINAIHDNGIIARSSQLKQFHICMISSLPSEFEKHLITILNDTHK